MCKYLYISYSKNSSSNLIYNFLKRYYGMTTNSTLIAYSTLVRLF